jgi:hypothetical protein
MSLQNSLKQLKFAKEIFEALSAGKHIDAVVDAEWWSVLQGDYSEDYVALFEALGKKIVFDPMNFAYFQFEENNLASAQAQRIVLFYLLLFKKKHEEGANLIEFNRWNISDDYLNAIRESNEEILKIEKMDSEKEWNRVINKAEDLGFLRKNESGYVILNASNRILQLFMEFNSDKDELNLPADETEMSELLDEEADDEE